MDDYHILTLGKAFTKNKTEYYSKYLVNLKSGKVEKEYFNTQIDINFNWTYMFNKNILTIENVMKEKNVHEECIQQMYRLVHDRLCNPSGVPVDDKRLIRMDD